MKKTPAPIITCLLMSLSAFAQEESAPSLSTEAKLGKLVLVEGETQFVELKKVLPGDIVDYVTTYSNNSEQILAQIKPEIKIPQGTLLEGLDKVNPAPLNVLIDGEYIKWPLSHDRLKELTLSEVQGFQWIIESLNPKEKKQLTVTLKIND